MKKQKNLFTSIYESILLEAPAPKVQKKGIKNPFLVNYIYRYEAIAEYNSIIEKSKNETDLTNLIKQHVEQLTSPEYIETLMVKPDDVNIKREKDIAENELLHNPENREIRQTLDHIIQHPKESQAMISAARTKERTEIINNWINYLMKENTLYVEQPAFQYMVLKSILTIPKEQQDPPLTLNPNALAKIFDNIKENPTQSTKTIVEEYKQYIIEDLRKTSQARENFFTDENGGNWIKLDWQKTHPKDFDKNVQTLMNISARNWCTAGKGMAEHYLQLGDFWVYYIKTNKNVWKAKIAFQMQGHKHITQARGDQKGSVQRVEVGYEKIALDFAKKQKFTGGAKDFKRIEEMDSRMKGFNEMVKKINEGTPLSSNEMQQIQANSEILKYILKKSNPAKITDEMKKAWFSTPQNAYMYAEAVGFDQSKIPSEIMDIILTDIETSIQLTTNIVLMG